MCEVLDRMCVWKVRWLVIYVDVKRAMVSVFVVFFFFLMIRRPPRSTQSRSSAASDVYKRQGTCCAVPGAETGATLGLSARKSGAYHRKFDATSRFGACLLYTSPSPRDRTRARMPSSAWKKKNNKKKTTHTITSSNHTIRHTQQPSHYITRTV